MKINLPILVCIFTPLTLSCLTTACSVKKTTFTALQPSLEKGSLVYIYRPSSMSNAIVSPDLMIDGEKTFTLSNNSYTYKYLPAGKHIFKLDLSNRYIGKTDYELDVLTENTYFIKASTSLKFEKNKPYTRRFDLTLIPSSIAIKEISKIPRTKENQNTKNKKRVIEKPPEGVEDDQFSINKTRNPFSK